MACRARKGSEPLSRKLKMLDVGVTQTGRSATLSSAILLYSRQAAYSSGKTAEYATIHPIDSINGRPEIMPGRLLTQADMASMVKSLGDAADDNAVHWVEPCVLARGTDRIVWWTPPAMRPMFFVASGKSENTFEGNAVCPVPGLVWVAMPGRGFYIYAVKGNTRPTQRTQLFQSPFFNVWSDGKVCIGSAKLPSEAEKWEPQRWENTFFGSRFTHPNFRQKDRLTLGVDPAVFWKQTVAKPPKSFPEKHLVQIPLTVENLLDRMFVDNVGKWQQAQGEF